MFKLCPECGQEYQAFVSRCAHCDVALVHEGEPIVPAHERAPEPPPPDRVLVKLDDPRELHELAEALQEQGISSWVDAHDLPAQQTRGPRLGLSVRRADLEAARAIAQEVVARSLPDLEESEAEEYDASSCPACGEPTPDNAAACGACGLEFPEVDPGTGQIVR